MRAIVQDRYGPPDILELREVEIPVARGNDVLVRVHATSVHGADWHLIRGLPYVARLESGLLKPKRKTPGFDLAGRVAAIGKQVKAFQPGDDVFGWSNGTYAEYVSVPEDALVQKPTNLSFEQAASVPISALTALQGLRDQGELQPGHQVLINGASGGVGTFAVQIAKALGAEVTGVCSARNLDLVRSIGADHAVDYGQEDFTQSGKRYDLILDMAQSHSLSDFRRALRPRGTLVMVGSSGIRSLEGRQRWFKGTDRWIKALALSPFVSQRLRPLISAQKKEDLETLKELIEAGKVTPVLDRRYPLSGAAEAIRYLEKGLARGVSVLTV
jgi:NADPH:quinone reductase-like Zn-dependent oxidoreductase